MTDEAKHTSGPWLTGRHVSGNGVATHVSSVGGGLIASVGDHDARCGGLHPMYASRHYGGNDRCGVRDANTRLIAAAPDMLLALEALTDPEGHIWHGGKDECTGECKDVRAALAKVEGKEANP